MPTTPGKKQKRCSKCGLRYQAWRCPRCHKGRSHGGSRSTFNLRGGASAVLGHLDWAEVDPLPVNPSAAALSNEPAG